MRSRSCARPDRMSATAWKSVSTWTSGLNTVRAIKTSARSPDRVGDDHGRARSRPGHTEEGVGVSEYVIRGGRRIEGETLESKTPANPKRTRQRPRQDQFVRVPLIWVDRLRGGRCIGSYRLALHLLFHHWKSDGKPIKLSNVILPELGVAGGKQSGELYRSWSG